MLKQIIHLSAFLVTFATPLAGLFKVLTDRLARRGRHRVQNPYAAVYRGKNDRKGSEGNRPMSEFLSKGRDSN